MTTDRSKCRHDQLADVESEEITRPDQDVDTLNVLLRAAFGPAAADDEEGTAPENELRSVQRYSQKRFLARGGMGTIYDVTDRRLNRVVAMKTLVDATFHEDSQSDASVPCMVNRFLNEAQVTAQLDHPGIVPVHELGFDDQGSVYFTMKLVKGRDLRAVLDHSRTAGEDWNLARMVSILVKVCHAMAYAHGKGVVHRDLKPANIMVGLFGEVYVMDWGLLRVIGREDLRDIRIREDLPLPPNAVPTTKQEPTATSAESPLVTMDGAVVGTPAYMSQEQAQGRIEDVDCRSDIYSMGAILYDMLADQPPYVDPSSHISPRAILTAVLQGPPPSIAELNRRAPQELIAICEKAMARERDQRYQSSLEMAEDLQAFLDHRVVRAYQTGALAELRSWVSRNRLAATVAALAGLLSVGMLSLFLAYQWRTNQKIAGINGELADANAALTRGIATERQNALTLRRNLYVASMRAADTAFHESKLSAAGDHLQSCPQELRSWEWRFLDSLLRREIRPLQIATGVGGVSSAVFGPDGDVLVVCGTDLAVKLFDSRSGKQTGGIDCVASLAEFRPDGKEVVLASKSGDLALWDLNRGPQKAWQVRAHEAEIDGLAISPDGAVIATGAFDKTVKLWDAATGQQLGVLTDHQKAVRGVAFHPEGQMLACGTHFLRKGGVTLWDLKTGLVSRRLGKDGQPAHNAVAFRSDRRLVATGGEDGVVHIWNVETGVEVRRLEQGAPVRSVTFSPDGTLVLSGDKAGKLRLWNVATGRIAHALTGISGIIWQARFDAAGERSVASCADGHLFIYDVPRDYLVLRGHAGEIRHGDFDPSGKFVATAGFGDGLVKLWDADSGEELQTFPGHRDGVWSVRFSPDGKTLLSAGADGTIRIWNVESGQQLQVCPGISALPADHPADRVLVADFGFDNSEFISASCPGHVGFWDLKSGRLLRQVRLSDGCWSLAISRPRGKMLLPLNGGIADFLDSTGNPQKPVLRGHGGSVLCAAFSSDGSLMATGGSDGFVIVRDAHTGNELQTIRGHAGEVWSVAFSPEGDAIFMSMSDGVIRVADIESGKELLSIFASDSRVAHIQFSPDGQRLLSCGADGTARIWETTPPGPELQLRRREVRQAARYLEHVGQTDDLEQVLQRLSGKPAGLDQGVHAAVRRIVESRLKARSVERNVSR